jgi:Ribosomal protein L7/L12
MGVPKPTINDKIQNLVIYGEKIKAIKMYRQATGVGLKEAKEYIDSLCEKLKN